MLTSERRVYGMSGEFILYKQGNIDDWYQYFDKLERKGIYHDPKYIHLMAHHYKSEPELMVYEAKDEFVYYPYFKRKIKDLKYLENEKKSYDRYYDIISSWYYGGPIFSKKNPLKGNPLLKSFNQHFYNFRKEHNIVSEFIRFDPNLENYVFFDGLKPEFNRKTVYVDLSYTVDDIWDNFEKRNRTSIRKARNSGITVKKSTTKEELLTFTEIYREEMKRKDADIHYWFTFEEFNNMAQKLKDSFNLWVTKYDGEIIGGGIVMKDETISHDFLRATLSKYWKYQPNNLLLFEELIWCKENGNSIFDFQGGRPGVYNFKKSFSNLGGKFYVSSLIHNKEIYNELENLAINKDRIDKSKDFFPKYRPKE